MAMPQKELIRDEISWVHLFVHNCLCIFVSICLLIHFLSPFLDINKGLKKKRDHSYLSDKKSNSSVLLKRIGKISLK